MGALFREKEADTNTNRKETKEAIEPDNKPTTANGTVNIYYMSMAYECYLHTKHCKIIAGQLVFVIARSD